MSRTPAAYLPLLNDWGCTVSGGHWGLIRQLVQEFDGGTVRDASLEWCLSLDNATRATGLDVLGCLAADDEGLVATLLDQALRAAASPDEDLRWSAAVALQHQDDERVQPVLIGLLGDSDSDVRWQAVFGLPGRRALSADHPVVHALVRAMEDESDSVRDWATFGLGCQSDVDSPAVRDALVRRLDDDGGDTAAEAVRGLARRKDPRAYAALVRALADPDVGELYVEAAEELADPRLLPLLRALRDSSLHCCPESVDDAIAACEGVTVRCRFPRRLRPVRTVTADPKVPGRVAAGCGTRLRTSSRPGSRPWRSP